MDAGLRPDGGARRRRYQPAALTLDALALADALAPAGRPAVLVGHDWGAICAYGAVVHRPERFARLVAMSVPHRARSRPG